MKTPKVFAHGAYIGSTGYNNHTRDFFRKLNNHFPLKFRNFTVDDNWSSMKDEPFNDEPYLTEQDKKILHQQSLWNHEGEIVDYEMYTNHGEKIDHNIHLVLAETNHHYFYENYDGPKIAYNVWESTLQPEGAFNAMLKFDQIWVPSKWQAECTIKQGADPEKVKVVPEGVDTTTFFPESPEATLDYVDGRFKFIHFGRWDYRKSTKELIETFLKTFDPSEPVDFILSIDNRWGDRIDGFKTTEERLEYWGLTDERLKIKHFPSREDYVKYLKNGNVFVSCARGEGWNLPLIEAMACGTPSIYSNCSGQLEFAEGKGLPVRILEERPTTYADDDKWTMAITTDVIPGNYYEPDFNHLSQVMRDAYDNYKSHKERALEEAKLIHKEFNWDHVGKIGADTIQEFLDNYTEPKDTNQINVSYYTGEPKVEITGDLYKKYKVEFIDGSTGKVVHEDTINTNMWTACGREYYTPWIIKVNGQIVDEFNVENKRVLIHLSSRAIGDTIAWAPYAIEFAKKNNCQVALSTFHNSWFEGLEEYKDIEFLEPGSVTQVYASYEIGWFKNEDGTWNEGTRNPQKVNLIPMQQAASDILGLEFEEVNHGLNFKDKGRPIEEKYVVIGPQATSGCKEWPYSYWTTLAKLLQKEGYKVISISKDPMPITDVIPLVNVGFDTIATYLRHADMFIGLGSGLSWFNWALGKHTYMINGFAKDGHEFTSNITRITNNVCISCWNDPVHTFNAGDWDWCPVYKGSTLQHTCQKSISPFQVFEKLPV